ncbi:MAG: hypothetical protein AABY83_13065 [Pseudomonadota bacterium]
MKFIIRLWVCTLCGASNLYAAGLDSLATRAFHRFSTNLTLAPAQVPFPVAAGANFYYIYDARWMIGIDANHSGTAIKILASNVDAVQDTHVTLQAMRFFGNSFHVKMGLGQRYTGMRLTKDLFDPVKYKLYQPTSTFETLFFRTGIGNLWHFNNRYSLGLNWLTFNIPLKNTITESSARYANTPDNATRITDTEDIIGSFPSGSFLQLELGMVF